MRDKVEKGIGKVAAAGLQGPRARRVESHEARRAAREALPFPPAGAEPASRVFASRSFLTKPMERLLKPPTQGPEELPIQKEIPLNTAGHSALVSRGRLGRAGSVSLTRGTPAFLCTRCLRTQAGTL